MSDPKSEPADFRDPDDQGENATGNQSDSAVTEDSVDSGQSEDIQSSLNYQGSSDRETLEDIAREREQGDPTHDAPEITPL
jgi:hypothetical protein